MAIDENKPDNKRGVVLLQNLDHEGMTFPAGSEIDFGNDEFEAALVGAGVAKWGKGEVPQAITPLQALAAIEAAGMKPVFDAVMAASPGEFQRFNLAIEVRRSSQSVEGLRMAANKTAAEIDDLFRLAVGL